MRDQAPRITRRRFLRDSARAASALALSAWGLEATRSSAEAQELTFPVEKGASLRVLRWSQFVTTDRPIFEENAARFTQRTGVPVRVEYETWTDVQPKAAAAANVGSGPDIVIGFFDEPHLWADKLVPVTDLAQYLGRKYGGWFDVCAQYAYSPQRNAWIAIPIGAPGATINYRVSWVREAGFDPDPARFPKTTDEFLRLCRALKARGRPTGFALGKAVGDGNVPPDLGGRAGTQEVGEAVVACLLRRRS
jgi:multiple sugar transport system substrate-binding protein